VWQLLSQHCCLSRLSNHIEELNVTLHVLAVSGDRQPVSHTQWVGVFHVQGVWLSTVSPVCCDGDDFLYSLVAEYRGKEIT
jgi:hypothetical protein